MITVLNYLKIPKLMDVYCAMLLTKFTTVGRTVKDVNQDLASRYQEIGKEKWIDYTDLDNERLKFLKKEYPFVEGKDEEGG